MNIPTLQPVPSTTTTTTTISSPTPPTRTTLVSANALPLESQNTRKWDSMDEISRVQQQEHTEGRYRVEPVLVCEIDASPPGMLSAHSPECRIPETCSASYAQRIKEKQDLTSLTGSRSMYPSHIGLRTGLDGDTGSSQENPGLTLSASLDCLRQTKSHVRHVTASTTDIPNMIDNIDEEGLMPSHPTVEQREANHSASIPTGTDDLSSPVVPLVATPPEPILLNAQLVDEDLLRQEAMAHASQEWNREMMSRTVAAQEVTVVVIDDNEAKLRRRQRFRILLFLAAVTVIIAGILGGTLSGKSRGVEPPTADSAVMNSTISSPTFPPVSPLFAMTNNTRCVDALPISTRLGFNTYRSNTTQSMESYSVSCPTTTYFDGNFNVSGNWYKFTPSSNDESITVRLCANYYLSMFVYTFHGDCGQLVCQPSIPFVRWNFYTLFDPIYNATLRCISGVFEQPSVDSKVLVAHLVEGDQNDALGGIHGVQGQYTVTMTTAYDLCPDAKWLRDNTLQNQGSTLGAYPDVDTPLCDCNNSLTHTRKTPGVWYRMVGHGYGVIINTCGSSFPARLSIFLSDLGASCDQLRCVDNVMSYENVCENQAWIAWVTDIYRIYYILLHGDETNTTQPNPLQPVSGKFLISTSNFDAFLMCDGALIFPIDELLSKSGASVRRPKSFFGLALPSNSSLASRLMCGSNENPVPVETDGTWYTFEGFGAQLSLSTCNNETHYDTKISVFKGSCSNLVCVTAKGNGTRSECRNFPDGSSVEFFAEKGTTYFVLVHGSSTMEEFALDIRLISCSSIKGPYIVDGRSRQSTTDAAIERNMSMCGGLSRERSLVFAYYGTGSRMTASTCDDSTNAATKLSIMTKSCSDSLWSCHNTSNFSASSSCGGNSVSWNSSPGELYYVVIYGELNNSVGMTANFSLSVTFESSNSCIDAVGPFAYPLSLSASTLGSTGVDANTPTCGAWNHTAPGMWYTLDGVGGNLALEVCPQESVSLAATVYSSDCNAPQCVTLRSNSTCGPENALEWLANSSQSYHVLIEGVSTDSAGSFEFNVHPGQAGKTCEQAQLIPEDYFSGGRSLAGTITSYVKGLFCGPIDVSGPGVWFKIEGLSGMLNLNTCMGSTNSAGQTSGDTFLSVFAGSCGSLLCVAYNDDGPGNCGLQSNITFIATATTTYYVLVGRFEESADSYVLNCGFVVNTNFIVNDKMDGIFCQSSLPISIGDAITASIPDCNLATNPCPDIASRFWSRIERVEGMVNVNTCSNTSSLQHPVDTFVGVYSGTCGSLKFVNMAVPSQGFFSGAGRQCGSFDFDASALETYYIVVLPVFYSSMHGDFVLSVNSRS